jgi:hypothetical protein
MGSWLAVVATPAMGTEPPCVALPYMDLDVDMVYWVREKNEFFVLLATLTFCFSPVPSRCPGPLTHGPPAPLQVPWPAGGAREKNEFFVLLATLTFCFSPAPRDMGGRGVQGNNVWYKNHLLHILGVNQGQNTHTAVPPRHQTGLQPPAAGVAQQGNVVVDGQRAVAAQQWEVLGV